MSDERDREFMRLAIKQARKCVPEPGAARPKVGAVVVKDGAVVATAFRGELKPGEHAEYTALERKLPHAALAGATVYTTLEPCTTRGHPKIPCVRRLLERKVKRVVIGTLDPNPDISGKGHLLLREHNIDVLMFPSDLAAELEELNRDFIRAQSQPPPAPPVPPALPAAGPPGLLPDKLTFIRRLGDNWRELCDALGIPLYDRNRFHHGEEPRGVWEWAELRDRLTDVPQALVHIGRYDLLVPGAAPNPR